MAYPDPNKKAKTRINADGEVVRGDDDLTTPSSAVLRSGDTTLNVFGFNLQIRQFLIVLGLLTMTMGLRGTLMVLGALGMYTLWNRVAPAGSHNSSRGGACNGDTTATTTSRPRSGESRIRGIKDLPCDPKGG